MGRHVSLAVAPISLVSLTVWPADSVMGVPLGLSGSRRKDQGHDCVFHDCKLNAALTVPAKHIRRCADSCLATFDLAPSRTAQVPLAC
jgi:hypothetical protein